MSTRPRPSAPLRSLSALFLVTALMLGRSRPAAAEYAQLGMAKSLDQVALLVLAPTAAVLGGFSVRHLARGKGPESGRTWIGSALLVNGALLFGAGAMGWKLAEGGYLNPDTELKALTGTLYGLAAVSAGLGVVTMFSRSDEGARPAPPAERTALVLPYVAPDGRGGAGGGLALAATF